ncbi:Nitrate reductase NADH 1 [Porphyridium purpureum]|uniref:Nitrate reductase NADH 1 n=1 Tax=Porphyridium purpureum TaxID=35688 RepID=A0A5J4Z9A5_PORPP|nr:Nitrate reductase NADH 1 [Porphyridium purpureum]|eukprot:POR3077..scf295_1
MGRTHKITWSTLREAYVVFLSPVGLFNESLGGYLVVGTAWVREAWREDGREQQGFPKRGQLAQDSRARRYCMATAAPFMMTESRRTSSLDSLTDSKGPAGVNVKHDATTILESVPTPIDLYTVPGDAEKTRTNVLAALHADYRPGGLGPQHVETEVLDVDKSTPDAWVPRSKELIRLTGKHPFNCEPEIGLLLDQGFFTPPSIHYIRNHGYAMKDISWETHELDIGGLVAKPITLSMDELAAMPSVSLPVSLVCAGNRRKEQNMTKQTIGFSWGPCAVGTHIWTGVRLRDLLLATGVDLSKAKHVCFVGAEDLPKGKYGTSIPISLAMDVFGEVMIAYENNGMRLTTDHGFPVRVIIPGWIGGRMVKWLKQIIVSEEPSDNYYHFFDNRIMPPHVTAELAEKEGWWTRPEYLFNELNINSAIGSPNHDERLDLSAGSKKYTMRGYAYSGGGRKVTRVEVSLNGGKTWELAAVDRPEEKFSHTAKFGRFYCWAFWTLEVDTFRFLESAIGPGEVMCRAWDESNNTQPAALTWNLMGMGNNPHFRVKIHPERTKAGFSLRFEHPTVAGPTKGGWMNPLDSEELQAATKLIAEQKEKARTAARATKDPSKTYFKWDEIRKHDNEESAWIVVHEKVYDCTPFLADHPGGGSSIVMNAGADSTEEFDAIHSSKAQEMLKDYYIGELDADAEGEESATDSVEEAEVLIALDPKKKVAVRLVSSEKLTHNTRRLRFALPTEKHLLGLPTGFHMLLSAKVDGKLVMRAYTPTTCNSTVGYFELVVKIYFANEHPKFPNGGVFSQYLNALNVGDTVDIKGPIGHVEYKRHGHMIIHGAKRGVKQLGFICGGSGITPAYQIIQQILTDKTDATELFLLYANNSPSDILLKTELDAWAREHANFHLYYTVSRVPDGECWEYGVGYITEDMIRERLPAPGGCEAYIGLCGPPSMINLACLPNLAKVGHAPETYGTF